MSARQLQDRPENPLHDASDATHARVTGLLTPAGVAEWLNVDRAWVYEHAADLGAQRLGNGPKARLRFERERVLEYLNGCSDSRESAPSMPSKKARSRPSRRHSVGTNVVLLPIRGQSSHAEAA